MTPEKAESLTSAPTASKRRVTWTHDYFGRRVRQVTEDGSSGSYVTTEDLKIVSDGWQNVAELNGTNAALIRSYVWGLDLSASQTGAGGVGGLLLISYSGKTRFYAMDGNGNVAGLTGSTDGKNAALYGYQPFGQLLRAEGEDANANKFTFSTKRRDRTTRRSLYEYREYDGDNGRWLSRDPIGEIEESINAVAMLSNDSINSVDLLGLICAEICKCKSVKVTFNPGGDKFDLGFVNYGPEMGRESRYNDYDFVDC